jgi:rsbT co-antagonist protein RsbR
MLPREPDALQRKRLADSKPRRGYSRRESATEKSVRFRIDEPWTPEGDHVSKSAASRIADVVDKNEKDLLNEWVKAQLGSDARRPDLLKESELREQSHEFLSLLRESLKSGAGSAASDAVRDMLTNLSRTRTQQGFTPSEVASFILSFKQPLFAQLRKDVSDAGKVADDLWSATMLLDELALFTMEMHQKSREEIINRQQQDMLELSTPVVKLWEGVLALPMIGTLDSGRTQVVMEQLLNRIVETGADIAILDITGVPTVDTLVAQHLLKTVTAARLMGADCIISGIRPQIAQTIVHLGVDLKDVITKASLADAFALALQRRGMRVVKAQQPAVARTEKL